MTDNTAPIARSGDPSWMHRMDARSRRLPAVHDGLAIAAIICGFLFPPLGVIPATMAGWPGQTT